MREGCRCEVWLCEKRWCLKIWGHNLKPVKREKGRKKWLCLVWKPKLQMSLCLLWWRCVWYCCFITNLCWAVCDPVNCMGLSVCGILQARILEWVAISSSGGSSWPRDQTQVPCIAGGFITELSGVPRGVFNFIQMPIVSFLVVPAQVAMCVFRRLKHEDLSRLWGRDCLYSPNYF